MGGLPPRCPTFPFCVILCKGDQALHFCARHLHVTARIVIHRSMRYQGGWVPCWDPWATGDLWGLSETWSKVILQHHSGQKDFYICLSGQRGATCQRWESDPWPSDLEAAQEMWSVKRHFSFCLKHNLSTWPYSIVHHLTNFSAAMSGSEWISHDLWAQFKVH